MNVCMPEKVKCVVERAKHKSNKEASEESQQRESHTNAAFQSLPQVNKEGNFLPNADSAGS